MSNISIYNTITMSSLELAKLVGVEHSDFLKKVPRVLEVAAGNFASSYKDKSGKTNRMYVFPRRESLLMAMSYSYEMQAKVLDRMTALEKHLDGLTIGLKHRYTINLPKIPVWAFSALQMAETRFHWKLAVAGYQLPSDCCPDISIGLQFCKYMRNKGRDTDSLSTYTHEWGNNRPPVQAKLYPNEWLTEFLTWFDDQWVAKYLKSDSVRRHLPAPDIQKCGLMLGVSP